VLKSAPENLRPQVSITFSRQESTKFGNPQNSLPEWRWVSSWFGYSVDAALQRLPFLFTEDDRKWQVRGSPRQHGGIQDAPCDDGIQCQCNRQPVCCFQLTWLYPTSRLEYAVPDFNGPPASEPMHTFDHILYAGWRYCRQQKPFNRGLPFRRRRFFRQNSTDSLRWAAFPPAAVWAWSACCVRPACICVLVLPADVAHALRRRPARGLTATSPIDNDGGYRRRGSRTPESVTRLRRAASWRTARTRRLRDPRCLWSTSAAILLARWSMPRRYPAIWCFPCLRANASCAMATYQMFRHRAPNCVARASPMASVPAQPPGCYDVWFLALHPTACLVPSLPGGVPNWGKLYLAPPERSVQFACANAWPWCARTECAPGQLWRCRRTDRLPSDHSISAVPAAKRCLGRVREIAPTRPGAKSAERRPVLPRRVLPLLSHGHRPRLLPTPQINLDSIATRG